MRRLLVSVDLRFRGTDYRIREDIRDRSSIRPMPDHVAIGCTGCDRVIRRYSGYLQTPTVNAHPACAIRAGLLVPVGKSESTTAPGPRAVAQGGERE